MAVVKAQFKTAYLQREVVMDAKIAAPTVGASSSGLIPANVFAVGDVVYNNAGTLTARTTKASVVAGDYFFAQSDQTMGYGHVPVEDRDYRYNPKIEPSATEKKVALFKIVNIDDVIVSDPISAH